MKSPPCYEHLNMQSCEKVSERIYTKIVAILRAIIYRILYSFRFDFIFLTLSMYLSFRAMLIFTTFHWKVKRNCFLFGDMNDLKRVLTPGPAIVCNGHILYSGISCAISVWLAKRVLDDGAQYFFDQMLLMVAILAVPVLGAIDYYLLHKGIEALCLSLVSLKWCSFSGVWAIDFRTFTPRYMNAWSFYSDLLDTKFAIGALIPSWLIFVVLHVLQCRRYRKHPDGNSADKDRNYVELYMNNNTL